MTFAMKLNEERAIGRNEGRAEGRLEGEEMLANLIQFLQKNGRDNEISKVTSDENYRKQMYREAGIID